MKQLFEFREISSFVSKFNYDYKDYKIKLFLCIPDETVTFSLTAKNPENTIIDISFYDSENYIKVDYCTDDENRQIIQIIPYNKIDNLDLDELLVYLANLILNSKED